MKTIGIVAMFVAIDLITACTPQRTAIPNNSSNELVESNPTAEPTSAPTEPPVPTEAPICDPAAAGASQVLYSQDFSDPATGWVEILDEDPDIYVHARTEDGMYKFTGRWFAPTSLSQNFPSDIIFETDIQFAGNVEKTDNQLIQQQWNLEYRNTPDYEGDGDYFYKFVITGEGYYWFEKVTWKSDGDVIITDRVRLIEPQQIPDFNPAEMNRIKLAIVGDDTGFYVNDQLITTVTDPFTDPYEEYKIYFGAIPYFFNGLNPSETHYQIYLDNICIFAP